jgi:uncharacterized protein (DUF697 family)
LRLWATAGRRKIIMSEEDKKVSEDKQLKEIENEPIQLRLKQAMNEVEELGGWGAFNNGIWLVNLIKKSFRNLYEHSDPAYFLCKYPFLDDAKIAKKMTAVATRNAAMLGIVVGATVSTDEILAILTGFEGGVGLPANAVIAFLAVAGEAVLLTKIQLKLVANIAKLYGVPLDPDDPEDILTIIAFAVGGSAAESVGKAGMRAGAELTERLIQQTIRKDVLESVNRVGRKIGVKILQRTIIKYAAPIVSMGIGGGWNYFTTRAVGRIARNHFIARAKEIRGG